MVDLRVSKDVEVLFLRSCQLSTCMYMLLVSVAVKHVLYEILDHVTHITVLHNYYCTWVTVLYTVSFILAHTALVSSADFVILFFHQLFVNCLSIGPGIRRVSNRLVPQDV